jgi:hypothetical protein
MSFRIKGLPAEPFADLFALSDQALKARGAVRQVADNGTPCRVSLTDAEPGQPVVLVNYEHQPADSPYRSRFAIYVREGERTFDEIDRVPDQLRKRMLSVRAFDKDGMVDTDLVDGRALEPVIERILADARADYIHLHFARPGCYAARVERA